MKMMSKAAASEADEVIFDLEDACPPAEKESARALVAQALSTLNFHPSKVKAYRINAVGGPYWEADLSIASHADIVVIPKVLSVKEVEQVIHRLPPGVKVEVLIETAAGLLAAPAIAQVARVESLIFGVADFAAEVGARDFRDEDFGYARAQILVAARAAGIQAVDSVTVRLDDASAVMGDADRAARMGFDGKWAIHPAQIAPIHRAFNPTVQQLEAALRIVQRYQELGRGSVRLQGEMVDEATVAVARKTLEFAERVGLLG
jgi:citrate lyase subunit beta/citryl-CoA lyase